MANFPTNLDTIKKDWANDSPVKDTHPSEHNLVAESVEALEVKVGVDGSAVTTTHDYKLSNVTDGDKAVAVADYDTKVSEIETDITDLETAITNLDDDTVKLTGTQSISDVKTFSSSPVVPTPTTDFQTSTKKYVDDALTGINKSSVGLYTQGDFIDQFTMDLQFRKKQVATQTANTGMNSNVQSIDSLDNATYLACHNQTFYEYTKSGTVFTESDTIASVINNASYSVVKYLSATEAVMFGKNESNDDEVYVAYLQKSGSTWSKTNQVQDTMPGSSSTTRAMDIWVESSTVFYTAINYNNTNVFVKKFIIAGGNVVEDNTYSRKTITPFGNGNLNESKFNSADEIFVLDNTANELEKRNITTGNKIGNTLTTTRFTIIVLADDKIAFDDNGVVETYDFDGTDFVLTSLSNDSGNDFDMNNAYIETPNIIQTKTARVVLTGTGTENSIEDTSETGHLRYMSSTTITGNGGQTIIISGSVSNNGEFTTDNIDSGSINKVMLNSSPTAVETVLGAVVTTKISPVSDTWMPKGSNYYLGNN